MPTSPLFDYINKFKKFPPAILIFGTENFCKDNNIKFDEKYIVKGVKK